jgi:hypothetical protein
MAFIGTAGGSVVEYIFLVLLHSESGFRQHLLVVLRMHIPLGYLPRCVSGEQRGGAVEILSRIEVEQGECTQSTDSAAARIPPSRDSG